MTLLIIGNRGGSNVGESFERAAKSLQITSSYLDSKDAMAGPRILRQACWHLLQHRPLSLGSFSRSVYEMAGNLRPQILLTTGLAPVDARALAAIGELGVIRCNFLTDDPWSVSHRNPWFFDSLSHYDLVCNPRRQLSADIQARTRGRVIDLQFAVDPDLFQPTSFRPGDETYCCDVMFAGGADRDRVPYLDALNKSGLRTALYGSYWERYPETRAITRGQIGVAELPRAIAGAKVALCLVRRGNRDQHCMRTFEVPAVGGCMLTEDTDDHRGLFGPEGRNVLYFRDIPEMVTKARWLVDHEEERTRLSKAAQALIASGRHTYQDRLKLILGEADAIKPSRAVNITVEPQ